MLNRRPFTHAIRVLFSLLVLGLPVTLSAQSATPTLKLGEEPATTDSKSTLDLGPATNTEPATPVAKKPAASAPSVSNSGATKNADGSTTRHGSWEVGCPKGEPVCVMAQVGNDKSGTPILEMHLRKLPEPQSVQGVTVIALVDIITPLGAVLTSGLTMQIDAGEEQRAPFQICTEQGCLVREPLTEEAVNRFKRGNNARLTVVAAQQGELETTISLAGFTKAYDSL